MLNRGFIVLCISAFVVAIGAGIIAPILPLYAKNLGASGLVLGLMFSSFHLSMAICNPFIGRLSDLIGKKILITSGFGIGFFVAVSFVFAENPLDLIIIRLLQGITGAMIIPIVMAYLGELSPVGKEGTYMGVYSMMLFLGMAAGPVIGGKIADTGGMDLSFYSYALTMMIVFFITLIFLPTPKEKSTDQTSKRPFKKIFASKPLKGLFIFSFTLSLAQSGLMVFLPLFASNQQLTITQIGMLASCFVFFAGILQVPFGWLANHGNRVMLVMAGTLSIAVGLACIPLADGFLPLLIMGSVIGAASAMASPAANAMLVEHSREIGMGSVMGSMNAFTSLGMIVGPVAAGIVMDMINLDYAFYFYAVFFIVGPSIFYYFTKDLKGKPKESTVTPE